MYLAFPKDPVSAWVLIHRLRLQASTSQHIGAMRLRADREGHRGCRRNDRPRHEKAPRIARDLTHEVNRELVSPHAYARVVRPRTRNDGGIEDVIVERVLRAAHAQSVTAQG